MLAQIALFLFLILISVFHDAVDTYLTNLFMERDLEELGIDNAQEYTRKRIIKARKMLYILALWGLTEYDMRYLAVVLFSAGYLYKQDYRKRKRIRKQQLNQLRFQFPIWLRQLQILLQTNTVAASLQISKETAPSLIAEDLDVLIEELAVDAIHLQPYLNFLKRFRLAEIERAMKLLYRYNSVGKQDAYAQFNRMIQSTTKWLRNERYARSESKMMLHQWWGMLPLFGVTVLFMAVMFEIIVNLFGKGVA